MGDDLDLDEVETLLDAIEAQFDTVQAAIGAGETFLEECSAHFQVAKIIDHAVDLSVDLAEVAQREIVRRVCHGLSLVDKQTSIQVA